MGHTSKAPAGYQPSGQPQADQNYQNLVSNAMPWATALPGQVIPGLQQTATNVQNNPYFGTALQGSVDAASMGRDLSGYQAGAGQNLYNYGGAIAGLGNLANLSSQNAIKAGRQVLEAGKTGYGETQGLIPSTTAGAGYAPGMLGNATGLAGLTAGTELGAIPSLTGGMDAAQQVLNTGFDPQRALYDRSYQQMLEHQNAINAQSGVSGAYAAGLSGDAARNFDIDWQNNQLQRQLSALSGYGQEQGQVASNLTNLVNSAGNNYANLTNAGVNQYTGLTSNAAGNMSNLVNSGVGALAQGANSYNQGMQTWLQGVNTDIAAAQAAGQLYGQGSQLGTDALQSLSASSQLPSYSYLQQQQANIAALQALAQGGGAALQPSQGLISDEGTYLNIGQGATRNAQNAAQVNNAAQQQMMGNVTGMLGAAFGAASNPLSLFGQSMW